jgi:hypothetical protein
VRALTLTQPWATFVASGAKRIETRSWSTTYRGPLAIHAAKGFPMEAQRLCWELPEFRAALYQAFGHYALDEGAGNLAGYPFPRGMVVATGSLTDVAPIVMVDGEPHVDLGIGGTTPILEADRPFGDFTAGRYAWLLTAVAPLDAPIPARGSRGGLWEWEG